MMGRDHVVVGAAVGVAVVHMDGGPELFARAVGYVHPFALFDLPHAAIPEIPRLAPHALSALTFPGWFQVGAGFAVAYVVGVFFSAALALLPDIDSHASTFGQFFPDWARFVTRMKHRGETHWPLTGLLVVGLVWLCSAVSAGDEPASNLFPHLAMGGYLIGHLLCDLLTSEGLMLGGPFIREVVRVPFIRFEADSRVATAVAHVGAALIVLLSTGLLGPMIAVAAGRH